eukprot:2410490-Pyramimonas_sp.AAC.1
MKRHSPYLCFVLKSCGRGCISLGGRRIEDSGLRNGFRHVDSHTMFLCRHWCAVLGHFLRATFLSRPQHRPARSAMKASRRALKVTL